MPRLGVRALREKALLHADCIRSRAQASLRSIPSLEAPPIPAHSFAYVNFERIENRRGGWPTTFRADTWNKSNGDSGGSTFSGLWAQASESGRAPAFGPLSS